MKKIFNTDDPNAIRPAKVVEGSELDGCSAVGWEHCFDCSRDVATSEGSFRVYLAGNLSSARFVWVLLHGAGQSSLVWSLLSSELRCNSAGAVVAYDARGHGDTRCADEQNLSRERMAQDCVLVLQQVLLLQEEGKQICLVGHSMGGSTAVAVAALLPKNVSGLVVMDVVEGTAMASLSAIRKFVNSRPASFASVAQAVRWAVDSGTIKSLDSARISVPGQLRQTEEGVWVWRTDVGASSEFWQGWYENMSAKFLAITKPKMLMLAGMDRLDTPLVIGQMQGKFQLEIFPACSHQLHEEAPKEVCAKLLKFANRI